MVSAQASVAVASVEVGGERLGEPRGAALDDVDRQRRRTPVAEAEYDAPVAGHRAWPAGRARRSTAPTWPRPERSTADPVAVLVEPQHPVAYAEQQPEHDARPPAPGRPRPETTSEVRSVSQVSTAPSSDHRADREQAGARAGGTAERVPGRSRRGPRRVGWAGRPRGCSPADYTRNRSTGKTGPCRIDVN